MTTKSLRPRSSGLVSTKPAASKKATKASSKEKPSKAYFAFRYPVPMSVYDQITVLTASLPSMEIAVGRSETVAAVATSRRPVSVTI